MHAADSIPEPIIQSIHKSTSTCKLVIAMAGNGTQAISELMRYGNGSATLLAQHLLYDSSAFDRYIGGKPDKYVSPQASRQLAMAAYMESRQISHDSYPTAGIGCTSSLVKPDGEREGRDHLIFVSTQDQMHTRTFCISLDPSLKRSRVEEEWINAVAILQAVAACRGVSIAIESLLSRSDRVEVQESAPVQSELSELLHDKRSAVAVGGKMPNSPCVILAGSFNPLHPAHLRLLELASEKTGLHGVFELSITNVDKPPLDYLEIQTRLEQFQQRHLQVVVTNRPRYLTKAKVFTSSSTFVMGSDTFARVVNAQYYRHGETPLDSFESIGTNFLVAARRLSDGSVLAGDTILQEMPDPNQRERWAKITTCIPTAEFLMDLSSTEIRKGRTVIE